MPQFVEQEPPSGSPARKISERVAATCVRFRPAAHLCGCAKEDATVGRSDASRSSCARRKWSGAIRKGRPKTMPVNGDCGPTTTQGSQTMMCGCSEKYFLEGCYD